MILLLLSLNISNSDEIEVATIASRRLEIKSDDHIARLLDNVNLHIQS